MSGSAVTRRPTHWILLLVFVVQLAVPGWTIVDREVTLAAGQTFRFRTTVVDPYDPFRGSYVRVGLAEDAIRVDDPRRYLSAPAVYASIGVDDSGFARFQALSLAPPERGPYMKVGTWSDGRGGIRVRPPFDRYYLNEHLAPEAERVYRDRSGAGGDAYVTVAVRGGRSVLEGVYIEGESIEDYVRRLEALESAPRTSP